MAALHTDGAPAAQLAAPTSNEAPAVAAAQGFREGIKSPDCRFASQAEQALCVLEGEAQAGKYLARLKTRQAAPDDLALIVATLYGAVEGLLSRRREGAEGAP